ncbi:rod shape-determining protein MreD [Marinilabilia rubra]|uniref:Rod shape-determining protein MreD n=1 Tax=Marinilabilia rubra TaxID=2162893 RepID=A0A2U2BDH8_9BACT|nr:rod shape-determining protein MreD [Marinilabilia rubra]PWE01126.1 rod shape-determining protein MreD [Marinilabilia rubra]
MINLLPRYLFNFIILVLVQVLLLNNLQFSGYLNPYLYVLFIITLPFSTPKWMLVALGFTTGIIVDIFMNTLGLHAAATVFMAFVRPFILSSFSPRDGYEMGTRPIPADYGFGWFFKYSVLMVAIHHLFLFFVEAFSFENFLSTLWKSILSSIVSVVFIFIAMLFSKRKSGTI